MTFCAKFFVDKTNCLCYIRATEGKQIGQANKPERKKENDHYRNERVSFRRAERREKENAYGQRQSLFLHIHDL